MKPKKIVIAGDSFKGSLSSRKAGEAIAAGIRSVLPDAQITVVPVGDGGEGTAEALTDALGATTVTCNVHNPLMEPVCASYAISADGTTAVMELAAAAGLALVPAERRNPMNTTTFGLGEMIADALGRGVKHFLIGIGGSATNDGGAGMLAALGFRFYNSKGDEIKAGTGADLTQISRIEGCAPEADFQIACDVDNPFAGPRGAAYVFAPQKGASPGDVEKLDEGLRVFAGAIAASGFRDISTLKGAGAAGGVGGAFAGVLGADLTSGISLVLRAIGFSSIIEGADIVITGEGRIDSQTAMGKTPAGILAAATGKGIPVIAIGGTIAPDADLSGFAAAYAAKPEEMPLDEAMRPEVAARNLAQAAAYCISHLPSRATTSASEPQSSR